MAQLPEAEGWITITGSSSFGKPVIEAVDVWEKRVNMS